MGVRRKAFVPLAGFKNSVVGDLNIEEFVPPPVGVIME
jgi:hypothetical protein